MRFSSAPKLGDVRASSRREARDSLLGRNSIMVASMSSVLSPDTPAFLPKQGPFSYSHAAGSPYWAKGTPGWTTKPHHGWESNYPSQADALKDRAWRPKTHMPTMPYRNSAIQGDDPYYEHGRGYRKFGLKRNRTCHHPRKKKTPSGLPRPRPRRLVWEPLYSMTWMSEPWNAPSSPNWILILYQDSKPF